MAANLWTEAIRRDPATFKERARAAGDDSPPRLAHDRLPHPQGLDRPQGGGRQDDRGLLACPPGAHRHAPRTPTSTCRVLERLAALLPPRGALHRGRPAPSRADQPFPPKGDRRMGANPHANGGKLLRDLDTARLPRTTRVDRRPPPAPWRRQDMLRAGHLYPRM